eukprot:scaffold47086_cov60-Phaeocystis_antarctica.AAC.4
MQAGQPASHVPLERACSPKVVAVELRVLNPARCVEPNPATTSAAFGTLLVACHPVEFQRRSDALLISDGTPDRYRLGPRLLMRRLQGSGSRRPCHAAGALPPRMANRDG